MNTTLIKHLAFYGGMITLVLVLFSRIASFGEANLEAADDVAGDYILQFQPPADGQPPLLLKLQQSGIYFAAALVPLKTASETTAAYPRTLRGQLHDRCPQLSGKAFGTVLRLSSEPSATPLVQLEGPINQDGFSGTLTTGKTTIFFMAQRQIQPLQQKALPSKQ